MVTPYTIGITGGSGSGKTHFLNALAARFNAGDLCLLSQDHYYKPLHLQVTDTQGFNNFDLPEAIDREAFHADIERLKRGEAFSRKEYTFNNPEATPQLFEVKPAPVLIVEGLFVQYFPEVERELDLKIFIDVKEHLKLSRRIRRDNEERGYGVEDVLYRYQYHVAPVYTSLIAPLKDQADIIIPNNSSFASALDLLTWAIQYHILKQK